MTVQRRGEQQLMEMNCVASARHHWRFPDSAPHPHVFITLKHGQLPLLWQLSIYLCELLSHPVPSHPDPSLPPPSSPPVAGLHYFPLRAKWDLSVSATVDWPVSKALHALKPYGSLIILFLSSISIVQGGISAGWPGCNAVGSSSLELQRTF